MNKAYVFGYGSLVQRRSRRCAVANPGPAVPVWIDGLRRRWECASAPGERGRTFLGVRRSEQSRCNGVLFPVSAADIEALDKRERGYRRVVIPQASIDPMVDTRPGWLTDAVVYTYATRDPQLPRPDLPIGRRYLETCLSGCLQIDYLNAIDGFAESFVEHTEGWGAWVDDRRDAEATPTHLVDESYREAIDRLVDRCGLGVPAMK